MKQKSQKKDNSTKTEITKIVFAKKKIREKVSFKSVLLPPNETKQNRILRLCFYGLAVLFLILMPVLSLDAGISGDEAVNYTHAGLVYDYYANGDTTALNTQNAPRVTYLEYYGQSFDNITYVINKWFGIDDEYASRHVLNSIVGWCIILVVGLFLVKLCGWRAGLLGLLFMFLSPRFLGHSFNNPKDIPFALGYLLAIYQTFLFCKELPVIKWKRLIFIALAIALANSVRIGGLMLIPYLFMFVGLWFLFNNPIKKITTKDYWSQAFKLILILLGISLVGYLVGLIFWPYALQAPFSNPIKALDLMTQFSVSLRQIFEGKVYWSNGFPSYYLFKFIFITTPIVVLLGFLLFFVFIKKTWKEIGPLAIIILIFSFIFPILYIIFQKSNVYGGWRHVLFTYPFMVIIAVVGYEILIKQFPNRIVKIATIIVIGVLLCLPLRHVIKNHPYEYVYFNELVGGINGIYGDYEMDYYFHSAREAAEWVVDNAEKSGLETTDKIRVASWHMESANHYFRKDTNKFEFTFSRWYERSNNDWDYAFYTVTGISPERINSNFFPPENTVHTIDVDGKPIAIIMKRYDKSDYYGYQQMQVGNVDSAIVLFNKALEVDRYNEVVLSNMANIYLQRNDLDSALYFLNRFLEVDPNRENEKYLSAYVYYYKSDFDKALSILKEMTDYNNKFSNAYILAAEIYIRKGDIYSAEKEYVKLINIGMLDQNAFNQLMRIYTAQGLNERTAQKKIFKQLSDSYKKLGNKEAAKIYKEQADKL